MPRARTAPPPRRGGPAPACPRSAPTPAWSTGQDSAGSAARGRCTEMVTLIASNISNMASVSAMIQNIIWNMDYICTELWFKNGIFADDLGIF